MNQFYNYNALFKFIVVYNNIYILTENTLKSNKPIKFYRLHYL